MFSLESHVQITCADHVTKHRVQSSCRGMARADTLSQQVTMCAPGMEMVSVKRALQGLVLLARLLHIGGNVSHFQPQPRRARGHTTRGIHLSTPQRPEEKRDGTDEMGTV